MPRPGRKHRLEDRLLTDLQTMIERQLGELFDRQEVRIRQLLDQVRTYPRHSSLLPSCEQNPLNNDITRVGVTRESFSQEMISTDTHLSQGESHSVESCETYLGEMLERADLAPTEEKTHGSALDGNSSSDDNVDDEDGFSSSSSQCSDDDDVDDNDGRDKSFCEACGDQNIVVSARLHEKWVKESLSLNADSLNADQTNLHLYSKDGFCSKIARDDRFHNAVIGIICLNAIYMGFEVESNDESFILDSHVFWLAGENFFGTIFISELVIRLFAFRRIRDCYQDSCFVFDALLVMLFIVETWMLPLFVIFAEGEALATEPLRLLRLLRLTRLTRILRGFPELTSMIRGMFKASRAVGSSLVLVAGFVYLFSFIVHYLVRDEPLVQKYFSTLPRCMWTLLFDGVFMDSLGNAMNTLLSVGNEAAYLAIVIFMLFTLLCAVTIMNMIIGLICEVMSSVKQEEQDEKDASELKVAICGELEKYHSEGMINRRALEKMMSDPTSQAVFRRLKIDCVYLSEFQRMLFDGKVTQIPTGVLLKFMLSCRGDQPLMFAHLAETLAFTRWSIRTDTLGVRTDSKKEFNELKSKLDDLINSFATFIQVGRRPHYHKN